VGCGYLPTRLRHPSLRQAQGNAEEGILHARSIGADFLSAQPTDLQNSLKIPLLGGYRVYTSRRDFVFDGLTPQPPLIKGGLYLLPFPRGGLRWGRDLRINSNRLVYTQ
jgi:hypothetical protein